MAKMDADQFKNFLTHEITTALSYIDSVIAERRRRILAYIQHEMYDLPAMKGRSSVTDGTVGSQIDLMMPGLMRIMTGGPVIGEYVPNSQSEEEEAKRATEFVNEVVLGRDNQGEAIIHDWGYDGLSQILGIVKGYWHEQIDEKEEFYPNLTPDQFLSLFVQVEMNPDLEITAHEQTSQQITVIDQATGQELSAEQVIHNVTVIRKINRSKVKLDNIPPEEFVISADARTVEDATLKSHRTYKRAGELKAMGYPADVIDSLPAYQPYDETIEKTIRGTIWDFGGTGGDIDPDMREIAIHQGIVRCNYDGKGIKEWYFVAAGNTQTTELLEIEPYTYQVCFFDFCPKPIPHVVFGRCPGDDLVPVQRAKTAVLRQTMDNLYLSNTPQQLVNPSLFEKGGLEAVINKVPGGIVLCKNVEMAVRDLAVPFFAQHSFPMLTYFDDEAEKRSGVSRASMGLDPDILQNQSATAANIGQAASMGKIELIARIWADGGMRKMFRGIMHILRTYHDFARNVTVNGKETVVDPRQWTDYDEWDVTVNTGLGSGSRERDLTTLTLISSKQEQAIAQGGPNNPVCTVGQYTNTLRDMVYAAGLKNPDRYYNALPANFQVPSPPPPGPTPDAVVYAKVEKAKIEEKEREAKAKIESEERIKLSELQSKERMAFAEMQVKATIEAAQQGIDIQRLQIDWAKVMQTARANAATN